MDVLYKAAKASSDDLTYTVMSKDRCVCNINISNGKAVIYDKLLMPFNLYLVEGDDIEARVNNRVNFYYWCSSRLLTLDRVHAKALLNSCGFTQAQTDKDRASIALQYRCLDLQDFYWVRTSSDDSKWHDINLFNNHMDSALVDVSLRGKNLTVTNSELIAADLSTNGTLPKAWVREESELYLLKGKSGNSIDNEVRAGNALMELGFNAVKYMRKEFYDLPVSMCKCFTSDSVGFVSAGDYSMNNELTAMTNKFAKQFAHLNLACYLTGNSDLHQDNWGLLYTDNNTMYSLAPLFDLDHCYEAEPETLSLPMKLLGLNMTQFDAAKRACQLIDIDIHGLINKSTDSYVRNRLESLL